MSEASGQGQTTATAMTAADDEYSDWYRWFTGDPDANVDYSRKQQRDLQRLREGACAGIGEPDVLGLRPARPPLGCVKVREHLLGSIQACGDPFDLFLQHRIPHPDPVQHWPVGRQGRDCHALLAAGLDGDPCRAYFTRGQMPSADRRIGREPVWRPATIRNWHSQGPRSAISSEPTD